MRSPLVVLCIALLGGCANAVEVVWTGTDTYVTEFKGVIGDGSIAAQRIAAQEAALAYCKDRGSLPVEVSSKQAEIAPGAPPSWRLEFRCANAF
jgi:hypothetical protein